jgi:hypothetical protein
MFELFETEMDTHRFDYLLPGLQVEKEAAHDCCGCSKPPLRNSELEERLIVDQLTYSQPSRFHGRPLI